MKTVLVVDDKDTLRDSVGFTLQRAGFAIISASSGREALQTIAKKRPDAVVTDLKMPGMTGVELIEKVREIDDVMPIVLMTAFGTIETAVRAMKAGAFDYITKPFEGDELIIAVKRALEHASLKRENDVLRATVESSGQYSSAHGKYNNGRTGVQRLVGESSIMGGLRSKISKIAESQGTVLIAGESGTGKEVVARSLHEASDRANAPFLAVNCAAMSESLLESELFGHERGAFTGADTTRKGRFELAHNGTLLLDEISEVKPQIQAKLLRVLQEQAFERVGSSTTIGVNVRVIATTNRDLGEEVARGSFRQDLFYRLNVLPISVPSLRERAADVRELAPYFIEKVAKREGRNIKRFTPEALDLLMQYPWPGNVRELQNLCERAFALCPTADIRAELIRPWLAAPGESGRAMRARPKHASIAEPKPVAHATARPSFASATPARQSFSGFQAQPARPRAATFEQPASSGFQQPQAQRVSAGSPEAIASMIEPRPLADIERDVIVETLHRFNGHRQKTAKALGIGVRTLGLKLKKWKEENLVEQSL